MKVLLFGATGMVGQGVLRECLRDPDVERVQSVGRGSTGQNDPKLRELVLSIFAGLLFGAVPVFKYAGVRLGTSLREGGRTLSQSRERHRARSTLVVVQVGLALVLLIGSGLMIRTFYALTQVKPGFSQPTEVQTLRISIADAQVPDAERVVRMYEAMLHKIESIPGVSAAGLSTVIPMDAEGSFDPVFTQDRTIPEGKLPPIRRFKFISPGFSRTIGTPLVAGRDLSWNDIYSYIPVALVSEGLAREYWKTAAGALGKRIRVGSTDDWREIIGVVSDVRDDGVNKPAPASVYWPILMKKFEGEAVAGRRSLAFAIRSSRTGSESFSNDVRQAIWSVNPEVPIADVRTLDQIYRRSMSRTSFTLVMLAIASGMALLLGIVGIYGVIAYSVSQRTREIGIRIALGARQSELTGMFVRHGMLLTIIGVSCGLVAALILMRLMSSLLFDVSPIDPLTYVVVCMTLVATATLASYLPSRRAASVDPAGALRAE